MSASTRSWKEWPYRIGCPVWTSKDWKGIVYPAASDSKRSLHFYSKMFGTVEGNSTFYALPSCATFEKWAEESEEGFQFSFKFPRSISHDRELIDCRNLLDDFLQRLSILRSADRLGPTFLQLGPRFSARSKGPLEAFLDLLPAGWAWGVEVRHADWFDEDVHEHALNEMLRNRGIDRVLFDSQALFAKPPSDAFEEKSQSRKPNPPMRTTVTGTAPILRIVGRNDPLEVIPFWQPWAVQIASWIRQGLHPWIFTHAPDDKMAPFLARWLHDEIASNLSGLPNLPSLQEIVSERRDKGYDVKKQSNGLRQLGLFD